MSNFIEAGRAGRDRASKLSLGGDKIEDTALPLNIQAAWLAARFNVGAAHARVIAEHAFAWRPQR